MEGEEESKIREELRNDTGLISESDESDDVGPSSQGGVAQSSTSVDEEQGPPAAEVPPRPSLATCYSYGSRRTSVRESISSFRTSVADMFDSRSSVVQPAVGLSRFCSTAVLVNYICAGYLLLPSAFAQAGTLLSCLVLAVVAISSYITATYLLEACARAELLHNLIQDLTTQNSTRTRRHTFPHRYSFAIRNRTFELSELCRIFLGRFARNFFSITTACDLYGINWAFAAVFGSTLSDKLPLGTEKDDYKIYVLIFMAITVPISCVPITDQLILQLLFLGARMLMVVLMLATTAAAYVSESAQFGDQVGAAKDVPLGDFSNLILLIQVCVFSTAFQFSVPGMAGASKNKKAMLSVISSAVSFVYVTNILLSLVLAIFFGMNTKESSNLNWLDYHGGTWSGTGSFSEGRSWWANLISSYVVLFAAVDGVAVYPLIAVSLGDILMGAVYESNFHKAHEDWKRRSAFRLLASIPQAVGALFVRDLGAIATYAGIFTIISYTICPSVLHIQGRRRMSKEDLPSRTYYQSYFSSSAWAYGLVTLACLVIIGVIVEAAL